MLPFRCYVGHVSKWLAKSARVFAVDPLIGQEDDSWIEAVDLGGMAILTVILESRKLVLALDGPLY